MFEDQSRPLATYRLQFNQDFRLTDAQALVSYFSRLGITHAYASPILRARQASTHGYDVVDCSTINPNLGDKTDLLNLIQELRKLGLGLILDIVPNHMAASIENPYWRDVLTYGHSSPFAGWFDIDWRMPDPDLWGRVLVPVLGEPLTRVLEQDQIRLSWSDGRFLVHYWDNIYPVDPATVPTICGFGLDKLRETLQGDTSAQEKIESILDRLKQLPKLVSRLRRKVDIDREETEHLLGQLAQVVIQSPRIQQWAEQTAEQFGSAPGGRQRLKKLLDIQPYRLVFWREAARTINYRRFFDINELVSVRQEDPRVFEDTHNTVLRWVEEGLLDGLRIDHIDGLRDPLGYLDRLREASTHKERSHRQIPIFVEKILAPDEKLPGGWPVSGTTGYEFLNQVEAIFVSRKGFQEIEAQYQKLHRKEVHFHEIAAQGKRRILRNDLSPQVGRLADILLRIFESHRQVSASAASETLPPAALAAENAEGLTVEGDINAGMPLAPTEPRALSKKDLVDAIVEVMVALPIYRTYVDNNHCKVNDADRRYVQRALDGARESGRAPEEAISFLGEVLLLDAQTPISEHDLHERVNFIQRFQQITGPAAAKGIEDTALYAYVPLVSLNEVGGEPVLHHDDPVAALHAVNADRAAAWPENMLCVTTHDTKRTADVRARLDVLSELPKLWTGLIKRWRQRNQVYRSQVKGKAIPDPSAESLFYQTVVGLWPAPHPQQPDSLPSPQQITDLLERVKAYQLKAAREAKDFTSWTNQNEEYESALLAFADRVLSSDQDSTSFLLEVNQLVARIARPGFWNSLARTLIQFTAPGSPDLYQGDELWNFALVDPDNRRPVDYATRQKLLDEVIIGFETPEQERRAFLRELVESPEDGRIKLHLIHNALTTRREYPNLFVAAQYLPLEIEGSASQHLLAFARTAEGSDPLNESSEPRRGTAAIILVPRMTASLEGDSPIGETVWGDTVIHLPPQLRHQTWTCALTRETIVPSSVEILRVGQALRAFPTALLINQP